MRKIGLDVWSYTGDSNQIGKYSLEALRTSPAAAVSTYAQLVRRVASLSFWNPEYVLFFRGQAADHHNSVGKSSIYPSIFRAKGGLLKRAEVTSRFDRLSAAEKALTARYNLDGSKRLKRHQLLRWAVLQHYEVCSTPLLDVTHSLRVACSFSGLQGEADRSYLYVLGLPQISGSVTASSEQGIQIIRLSSICPPGALRPHFQEAYVVGEYPTVDTVEQKAEYTRGEFDFARRLLCKFVLPGKDFWSRDFQPINRLALFPDQEDKLKLIADALRA